MARQSQLDSEIIKRIIAAQSGTEPQFNPSAITEATTGGINLADTILQRKQGQEDRVKKLKEEIEKATRQQILAGQVRKRNPLAGQATEVAPDEAAKQILQQEFDEKTKQALRTERPDNIKQFGQIGDQVVGLTYGGQVKPIDLGGKGFDPLTKTLPAEQVEKSAGFESMESLINRVRQDITNPQTGQLTEEGKGLLGPVDVTVKKAASYTPKADPMATKFYQKVQDLKNQIIYLRSGKQINEEEYKRLRASLPSEYRDESIFLSDLANFEKTFKDVASKRQTAFQQAGYKTPGMSISTPTTGNPGKSSGFKVISVRPSGSK